jgi:cytochrome c2
MPGKCLWWPVVLASALLLASCSGDQRERTAQVITGGDAIRGASAIERYGCGACHIIPGVSGAFGQAGPPLSGIANRIYIAGVLQNTPQNMVRWIRNPKQVDDKTVMPNLGVTPGDALDIAGYLYTLR